MLKATYGTTNIPTPKRTMCNKRQLRSIMIFGSLIMIALIFGALMYGNKHGIHNLTFKSMMISAAGGCGTCNCFAANSMVITRGINQTEIVKKSIDDLLPLEDKVLSFDPVTNKYKFDKILDLRHYIISDGSTRNDNMITLQHQFGNITLTSNHMIYVHDTTKQLKPASKVQIGDYLYYYNDNDDTFNNVTLSKIVDISNKVSNPRNVFTESGQIVVDNIAASNYIGDGDKDHDISHFMMKLSLNIQKTFHLPPGYLSRFQYLFVYRTPTNIKSLF